MADNDNPILEEFAAFLEQKKATEESERQANDDEIEVWSADGSGVRARQSKFKPSFLESLGFGSDPEPTKDGSNAESADGGTKPKGRQAASKAAQAQAPSIRQYFKPKA
jgi:hypothetical protein